MSAQVLIGLLKGWNIISPKDLSYCAGCVDQLLRGQEVNEKFVISSGNEETVLDGEQLLNWIHQQDIFHQDDLIPLNDRMICLFKGESTTTKFRIRNAEGDYVWLEEKAVPDRLNDEEIRIYGVVREVTKETQYLLELESTRSKLSSTNEIFRKSSEAVKIGYWEVDLSTMRVKWDDMIKEIHEVPSDYHPVVEQGISFYKAGPSRDKITNLFGACMEDGIPFDDEFELITAKGNSKWVRAIGIGKDVKGNSGKVYGLFQDIDHQKRSQFEIEKLSLVAKNVSQGVVITDPDGKIEWVNEGFHKLTGYTLPEIVGEKPGAFLQGDGSSIEDVIFIRNRLAEQVPFTHEIENYTKDGTAYWVELSITPVFENTELVRFVGIQKDITDRREAERLVQESSERVRNISNGVPGALLAYEITADGTHKCLYISEQVEEIFEVSSQEAMANVDLLWETVLEKDLLLLQDAVSQSAQNLELYDQISRIKTNSGKMKWLRATGIPKKTESGSVIWDTLIMDVTQIKENEEKLAEALDQKDQLFGELHHRIKNNLNMVNNVLYLKQRTSKDFTLNQFIQETRNRIFAIANTHEHLLRLEAIENLYVKEYLEELLASIKQSMSNDGVYNVSLSIQDIYLQVDIVVSLGLLVNEIVTNIFKHAYDPQVGGPITISLKVMAQSALLIIRRRGKRI
ncbi:MAG: PAS domain-containing protein [Ekhidna sp.]|nr:PAS domain-containing protein [Ekhidna sp.]